MPIVLPQVSYAPLYQATQLKGGARQALHGAQSLDLISRIRALQRQQRTTDTVLGIANLVLQLGNTVYGIFEQQQFEKAKGQMHDLRLDMQQKVQTYIDNNQLSWETDAQGNKVTCRRSSTSGTTSRSTGSRTRSRATRGCGPGPRMSSPGCTNRARKPR